MLQKSTALLLLTLLGVNAAGFLNVYQFMRKKTRHAPSEEVQLRREDMRRVAVPNGEASLKAQGFKRIEKGEYEYKGHRYDVIRREVKEDETIIYFTHDSYEEELLTFLDSFFNNKTSDEQNKASTTLKLGLLKQFLTSAGKVFNGHLLFRHILKPQEVSPPSPPFLAILSPPPRQA